MKRLLSFSVFFLAFTVIFSSVAAAHCQVPCGIYGDQRRFEEMLEDEHTISKSQIEINALAGKTDAQDLNQATRWVTTKEDHATNIQNTIAAYFMAQRIKMDDPNYGKKLMAAHKVIVMAMKAKQSADPATAKALEQSIFDFYEAYEGKKPMFDHKH
jgi:nickel superoxide dismutase